jgi:hypothetical protein
LDPDAWPKSRNGKKVRRPDIFKWSIMQEKKKKVVQNFEATLLIPSNIPLSVYGHIYYLLSGPLKNR